MNTPAYFEIQADDMARAVRFYQELFGWKFYPVEGMLVEYQRIETGDMGGGLLKRPAAPPAPMSGTNAYMNSMRVESFDAMASKIVALGGQVALPKFAVPGKCWQGYFIDTEGNTFGLFEVDVQAA